MHDVRFSCQLWLNMVLEEGTTHCGHLLAVRADVEVRAVTLIHEVLDLESTVQQYATFTVLGYKPRPSERRSRKLRGRLTQHSFLMLIQLSRPERMGELTRRQARVPPRTRSRRPLLHTTLPARSQLTYML